MRDRPDITQRVADQDYDLGLRAADQCQPRDCRAAQIMESHIINGQPSRRTCAMTNASRLR
jgi:hypothetical protein